MKILLILVLFIGGCALEPTVKVEDGNNQDQGGNNNPPQNEECKYVPLEGRILGEKRSISLTQEGVNTLYDFTCLGLTDESFNDLKRVETQYLKTNLEVRSITIEKLQEERVEWKFVDSSLVLDSFYTETNYFKQSVGINFSNEDITEEVTITIYTEPIVNTRIDYIYKGIYASGEVELVGISNNGNCQGDCDHYYN